MATLTKTTVNALPSRDKPYIVFDGGKDVPGFGVRVMPSGHKSFILEYRPRDAGEAASRAIPKKRYALGAFGPLTADAARKKAIAALVDIRAGGDPQAARGAKRAAATVSQLIDAFVAGHVELQCKPKTAEAHKGALERLRAAHGPLKASALTRSQVAQIHAKYSATPFAANRFLAVVSKCFSWAMARGYVPDGSPNPAGKIERYKEHKHERFLTPEELGRLGDALREAEGAGVLWRVDPSKAKASRAPKSENRRVTLDPHAVAAVRLLVLTGARLREVLDLQWRHVDEGRGLLLLPDSKTGAKTIYLSTAAQAVLASIPRVKGNPYVIAGSKDGAPRADLKKPWRTISRAAGLEDVRLHDLRHSFASVGAGASLGLPIIGKLLGHSQAATTQRYAHLDADPMRRAANTIGAALSAAMAPAPLGLAGRDAATLPAKRRQTPANGSRVIRGRQFR